MDGGVIDGGEAKDGGGCGGWEVATGVGEGEIGVAVFEGEDFGDVFVEGGCAVLVLEAFAEGEGVVFSGEEVAFDGEGARVFPAPLIAIGGDVEVAFGGEFDVGSDLSEGHGGVEFDLDGGSI